MSYESYKILLDLPAPKPALGFAEYAQALTEIIEGSRPRFAIGIFGTWGSGKTTLMETIEKQLDPSRSIAVRFSAWRYEKEEHLIVPLLDSVREGLVQWADQRETFKDQALDTAATLGKVMHSLLSGLSFKVGLLGAVDASFDANKALSAGKKWAESEREARVPRSFYHASFQALKEAFEEFLKAGDGEESEGDRRFVVFVDDLDRCQPEGALEVLESMKLFFDLEGFVFVVGLDRRVVETVIDSKYRRDGVATLEEAQTTRISGADYIKKIFQVPFALAPVSVHQLDEFVEVLCAVDGPNRLTQEQVNDFRDKVTPHLRYLADSGINPREIKRYINSYILQMKVKNHLDPDAVLAMQTLGFRPSWSLVQSSLLRHRSFFIDALHRQVVNEEPNALENLQDELDLEGESGKRHRETILERDMGDIELDEIFTAVGTSRQQPPARHVLILGDPGAGKTTVLRKLHQQVLRQDPTGLGLPQDTLPVFLPLRRLLEADLDQGLDRVFDRELYELSDRALANDLGRLLWKRGRLLLLFDGLDEIADDALRARVCHYIQWQLDETAGRDVRAVVSSRYTGYGNGVKLEDGFLHLNIRPLDAARCRQLVDLWFREAPRALPDYPPRAAREASERLARALDGKDYGAQRLKVLVGSPLLLTLLCVVVLRGGEMPNTMGIRRAGLRWP